MHIGLWGCGGMGGSLARALRATGEAQLAAAYDVRPEAAADLAGQYGAEAVASETGPLTNDFNKQVVRFWPVFIPKRA